MGKTNKERAREILRANSSWTEWIGNGLVKVHAADLQEDIVKALDKQYRKGAKDGRRKERKRWEKRHIISSPCKNDVEWIPMKYWICDNCGEHNVEGFVYCSRCNTPMTISETEQSPFDAKNVKGEIENLRVFAHLFGQFYNRPSHWKFEYYEEEVRKAIVRLFKLLGLSDD